MKSKPNQPIYQGLPTYFWGKRKLLPWIFGALNQAIPRATWPNCTFLDAFLGGGSISLSAKAYGFQQILANDWSHRSQVIGQAILANTNQTLSRSELLPLLLHDASGGPIETHYSPSVFSTRHARLLDQLQVLIMQNRDQTHKQLLRLLFWHLATQFVCFPTSLGTSNRPYAEVLDGLNDGRKLNVKRLVDGSFKRLCQPLWPQVEAIRKQINHSIFAGSPVRLHQEDAITFIEKTQGDILYLDPPYNGTLSYERTNRVLDNLLFPDMAKSQPNTSQFSQALNALDPLLETSRHIPLWLLSYGSKTISAEALKERVQRHIPHRDIQVLTRSYTHMPHVSKSQDHQELLVIAQQKGA